MKLSFRLICEQLKQIYPEVYVVGKRNPMLEQVFFGIPASEYKNAAEQYDEALHLRPPLSQDVIGHKLFLLEQTEEGIFALPATSALIITEKAYAGLGEGRETLETNAIIVPKEEVFYSLVNILFQLFQDFSLWESRTAEAIAADASLTEILSLANMVIPDTVWVSNSSLHFMGSSEPTLMDTVSAIWLYQRTYGYVPMDIVQSLIETGELHRLNMRHKAFTPRKTCFNLPYTCQNIFLKGELVAHLFVVSIYSNPGQIHLAVAERLGEFLKAYLTRHPELILGSQSLHNSFLLDVLGGKLNDPTLINSQLSYFGWKNEDAFSLLLVDAKNNPQEEKNFITALLTDKKGLVPQFFFGEDYTYALFHQPDIPLLRSLLEELARKNHCRCVLSRSFSPLTALPTFYQQSLQLIRMIGSSDHPHYFYYNEDYGLFRIIKSLLRENSFVELCQEEILNLYEQDRKNRTTLVDTLYEYLVNDRNVLKTARAMYIHRNTLQYRLRQIRMIYDPDTASADSRQYALLSIRILRTMGRKEGH